MVTHNIKKSKREISQLRKRRSFKKKRTYRKLRGGSSSDEMAAALIGERVEIIGHNLAHVGNQGIVVKAGYDKGREETMVKVRLDLTPELRTYFRADIRLITKKELEKARQEFFAGGGAGGGGSRFSRAVRKLRRKGGGMVAA